MRIAVRSGSLAGSASATRRARSQLIRAARISRLLDQAPARMCQRIRGTQIARRFEVFGDQGGVFADRVGVALFDRGGEPPVQSARSDLSWDS